MLEAYIEEIWGIWQVRQRDFKLKTEEWQRLGYIFFLIIYIKHKEQMRMSLKMEEANICDHKKQKDEHN